MLPAAQDRADLSSPRRVATQAASCYPNGRMGVWAGLWHIGRSGPHSYVRVLKRLSPTSEPNLPVCVVTGETAIVCPENLHYRGDTAGATLTDEV